MRPSSKKLNLLVSTFVLAQNIISAQNVRIRKLEVNESQKTNKRKLKIAEDEETIFKRKYNNKDITLQNVEFSSVKNTITLDGVEYSFDNLEELEMFSPEFKLFENGVEVGNYDDHKGIVFNGKDGENEIFVSHDYSRRINMIEIYDGENTTTLLSDLTMGEHNSSDVSDSPMHQHLYSDGEKVSYDYLDDHELETGSSKSIFTMQGKGCSYYRVIDVAIAFDTSFCKYSGGFKKAVNKVQSIVAIASKKYKQPGLCIKIRISAADGRCNKNDDPYNKMRYWISGCTGRDGLIDDFSSYWGTYMKYIPRDSAHLFTANKMDGPVGCSGIGVLCKRAYGVNQISYFYDMNLQAHLFAHELGHNCGAVHIGGNGYMMNPNVNHAQYGFSMQSIYQMNAYLKTATCLHYG